MFAYLFLSIVSLSLATGAVSLAKTLDRGWPTLYVFPLEPLALTVWLMLSVAIGAIIVWAAVARYRFHCNVRTSFLTVWLPGTILLSVACFLVLWGFVGISAVALIKIEYFVTLVVIAEIASLLGIAFGRRLVIFADERVPSS